MNHRSILNMPCGKIANDPESSINSMSLIPGNATSSRNFRKTSYLHFVYNSLERIKTMVFGDHYMLSHNQLTDIANFYINIAKYTLGVNTGDVLNFSHLKKSCSQQST